MSDASIHNPARSYRRKSSLSKSQVQLVELMQRLNYGRIEGMPVRRGQPVLDPPPRIFRKLKVGGENAPRQEIGKDDFELKAEIVELFDLFEEIGEGLARTLTIEYGLPQHLEIEHSWDALAVAPATSSQSKPSSCLNLSSTSAGKEEPAAR